MNGPTEHALDTRLLRFRSRPGSEAALPLALDLIAAKRWNDAIGVASSALVTKPSDVDLQVAEGCAYFGMGDLLRAQATLLEAAKPGTRKEPFRWLGEVLMKRGDALRAVKVLERAHLIDGADAEIATLLTEAQRAAKKSEEATVELPTPPMVSAAPPALRPVVEDHPSFGAIHEEEQTVARADLMSVLADATARRDAAIVSPMHSLSALTTPAGAMGASAFAPAPFPSERQPTEPPISLATDEAAKASAEAAKAALKALAEAEANAAADAKAATDAKVAEEAKKKADADAKAAELNSEEAAKPELPNVAKPRPKLPPPPRASLPRGVISTGPMPSKPKSERPASMPPRSVFESSQGEVEAPVPTPDLSFADARATAFSGEASADARTSSPPEEVMLSTTPGGFEAPLGEGSVKQAPRPFQLEDEEEDAPREASVEVEVEGPTPAPAPVEFAPVIAASLAAPLPAPVHAPTANKRGRGGTWALGLVLAGGLSASAYFGGKAYFASQQVEAEPLLATARTEARQGDLAQLVQAEASLRGARDLRTHAAEIQALLLFVQSERALEDGVGDVAALRTTLAAAQGVGVHPAFVSSAEAIIAFSEHDTARASTALAAALSAAPEDAFILYIAGRLGQRLEAADAGAQLETASQRDPALTAAVLALAETEAFAGAHDEALRYVERALERDASSLRAKLWQALLTREGDAEASLVSLASLRDAALQASPADVLLFRTAEAQLEQRAGRHDGAVTAIEAAGFAGVDQPRLLVILARAAQQLGALDVAQAAATEALASMELILDARLLVASIDIDRGDAQHALDTLADVEADGPLLVLRARASMLLGDAALVTTTSDALAQYVAEHVDAPSSVRAFQLRLALHREAADGTPAAEELARLLAEARMLAGGHPHDVDAQFALGEIAVGSGEGADAEAAMQQVVAAMPMDADAHYWLGRAQQLAGKTEEARASLMRAVELRPEHAEAQASLAAVLLEAGAFEEADRAFEALGQAGTLGRAQALLGLGRIDDARTQLASLPEAERRLAPYVLVATRLELAVGHPNDAVALMMPLVNAPNASPLHIALQADALMQAGAMERAMTAYGRALDADAALPEALIGRAELYVRGQRGADALELLDRAAASLEVHPRPPALRARMLVLRGRVSLLATRLTEAREPLRQATEIAGCPSEAWFWLGEALAGANSPEARAAYEHYLDAPSPNADLAARARRAINAAH